MLPLITLSNPPVEGHYTWGAEILSNDSVSYEMGGKGISDPTGGLLYQMWKAELDLETGSVLLSAPNTPEFVLYSEIGITQMDVSFDQNMFPVLTFVKGGIGYLRWYNAVVTGYEVINLGPCLDVRCILDDKRDFATGQSDVLVFYLVNGSLKHRMQRDRYLIEYDLGLNSVKRLHRVGFTDQLRIQIQVVL